MVRPVVANQKTIGRNAHTHGSDLRTRAHKQRNAAHTTHTHADTYTLYLDLEKMLLFCAHAHIRTERTRPANACVCARLLGRLCCVLIRQRHDDLGTRTHFLCINTTHYHIHAQ